MSPGDLVASAPLYSHMNIGHSWGHNCAKLAAVLGVVHNRSTDPCLMLGQRLAHATDLRPCKTVVAVACCFTKGSGNLKQLRERGYGALAQRLSAKNSVIVPAPPRDSRN